MKKIIGIGNALVDIMAMIDDDGMLDSFSLPKGSMQLVDRQQSESIKKEIESLITTETSGGSAANTMHGLAMLGADAGFIGSIGKDRTGDLFEDDMKRAGVKTHLLRRDYVTGTAVTLISPDKERTFATHLGAAVEMKDIDISEDMFKGYDILYLEGYQIIDRVLVEKVCRLAKENKMEIAIDLASYNVVEDNRDTFLMIIEKYCDIVFANKEEARSLTGLDSQEALEEISKISATAVVKVGEEGSWLKSKGEEVIRISPLPVDCCDTTGAGDMYAAGFLYGYANGWSPQKSGALSSLLAGKVIENVGARIEKQKWPEIIKGISQMIRD